MSDDPIRSPSTPDLVEEVAEGLGAALDREAVRADAFEAAWLRDLVGRGFTEEEARAHIAALLAEGSAAQEDERGD